MSDILLLQPSALSDFGEEEKKHRKNAPYPLRCNVSSLWNGICTLYLRLLFSCIFTILWFECIQRRRLVEATTELPLSLCLRTIHATQNMYFGETKKMLQRRQHGIHVDDMFCLKRRSKKHTTKWHQNQQMLHENRKLKPKSCAPRPNDTVMNELVTLFYYEPHRSDCLSLCRAVN